MGLSFLCRLNDKTVSKYSIHVDVILVYLFIYLFIYLLAEPIKGKNVNVQNQVCV